MTYIPRLAEALVRKNLNSRKILILLGARQVGKTTLLSQVIAKQNGRIFNLDVEIDKTELLANQALAPDEAIKNLGNPKILIIDEAQRYPQISRIVKGWYDSGVKTKIILSGSSSLNLLDQSAEPLTGRNEKIFLPPLVFQEILRWQTWYPSFNVQPQDFSSQTHSLLLQSL
ncbi:MAG: AAA family ATPase, partial [Patescibacteria group bacterium]|nr:AAA family ATPase [Patescibacteria group bacterium]